MSRKIKTLGLALAAALALTAVTASTASAQFTSASHHTFYFATQIGSHVFTAGAGFGAVTCANVEFEGTETATSSTSLTATPAYLACKDSLGRTVDIDNTGLHYVFTSHGKVHISGGLTMTVTNGSGAVVCTVQIEVPQTNSGVGYHNLGGTNGITVTTNTKELRSVVKGGFFSCGNSEGTYSSGTYAGHSTLKGHDTDYKPVAISVHGPTEP